MKSKFNLALTHDKKEVVLDTDPRASTLLVGAGCEVPEQYEDDVRRFKISVKRDPPPVEVPMKDAYTAEELGAMPYGDLKAVATAKSIAFVGVKKADLIEALVKAFEVPAPPVVETEADEETGQ